MGCYEVAAGRTAHVAKTRSRMAGRCEPAILNFIPWDSVLLVLRIRDGQNFAVRLIE
jgi:hypothetical protein